MGRFVHSIVRVFVQTTKYYVLAIKWTLLDAKVKQPAKIEQGTMKETFVQNIQIVLHFACQMRYVVKERWMRMVVNYPMCVFQKKEMLMVHCVCYSTVH